MSIGILISVHDGIVLASDSASTLTVMTPQGGQGVVTVYNNANKIFNLHKRKPIGCVAFGSGSIGNASISTLLKDFRAKLKKETDPQSRPFDIENYTVQQVAEALTAFLQAECDRVNPPKPTLGILLGGYSKGPSLGSLGEGWAITIKDGKVAAPTPLRHPQEVGISWGGEAEAVARLVHGFSPSLPEILGKAMKTDQSQALPQLMTLLRARLTAPIVFPPMPIQDAIDLAEFLVHASIVYSRFTPGAPTVGGPIEIAAITKHEGFRWIKRKHYYDVQLNREQPND
jgi:hypothetical protein